MLLFPLTWLLSWFIWLKYSIFDFWCIKYIPRHIEYKEGNNRLSSVNKISLVNNHKAGNKCYTQDNKNAQENPSLRIGVNCCGQAPAMESGYPASNI